MRRLLRLLLICSIALALPLQGLAAVTRLACTQHAQQGHQQLDGAPPQVHAGHGDAAAMAGAVQAHDHDHDHGHATAGHAAHKCSACAACNVGVAMVAAPARLAVEPLAATASFAPLVAPALGFVTDGPDRPPRARIAQRG